MIKKADFSVSRRVYALNFDKTTETHTRFKSGVFAWYRIPAVWYKRKNLHPDAFENDQMMTFATYGEVRILQVPGLSWKYLCRLEPLNLHVEILGHYAGESFCGTEDLKMQKEIIALLKPMLKNIPSFPAGYEGWFNIHSKG